MKFLLLCSLVACAFSASIVDHDDGADPMECTAAMTNGLALTYEECFSSISIGGGLLKIAMDASSPVADHLKTIENIFTTLDQDNPAVETAQLRLGVHFFLMFLQQAAGTNAQACHPLSILDDWSDTYGSSYFRRISAEAVTRMKFRLNALQEFLFRALEPSSEEEVGIKNEVRYRSRVLHPCIDRKNPYLSAGYKAARQRMRTYYSRPTRAKRCPRGTSLSPYCEATYKILPCISDRMFDGLKGPNYMCHPLEGDAEDLSLVPPSPLVCRVGSVRPDVCGDGSIHVCAVPADCEHNIVPRDGLLSSVRSHRVVVTCEADNVRWRSGRKGYMTQEFFRGPVASKVSKYSGPSVWLCASPNAVKSDGNSLDFVVAPCEPTRKGDINRCPPHGHATVPAHRAPLANPPRNGLRRVKSVNF